MVNTPKQEACILLVDDEPKNIQLLANLLQEQGYAFEFATNGAEALHWIDARSFDLILLDIMMPGLDGYEVCHRLKQNAETREIPIIFLTAKTETESIVKGFRSGAVDYITKPFQKEELLARISTHIALVHQQRALEHYARLVEKKNLELGEKNSQLEDLNAGKDKLFSIIAHDLRGPLGNILIFADLLEDLGADDHNRTQKIISQFRASAKNLVALLENLLDWARMQRSMVEYRPKNLNIKHIIEWNMNLLQSTASRKKIHFHNALQHDLQVFADLDMLNTVMRNLLSNAVKFSRTGETVEIQAVSEGNMVKVAVSDNGIGIPEQKLSNLFRVGTKTQQRGTDGERGTGLGLLLCKEFIEKHGGTIEVESIVDKGTTFSFRIPRSPEPVSS